MWPKRQNDNGDLQIRLLIYQFNKGRSAVFSKLLKQWESKEGPGQAEREVTEGGNAPMGRRQGREGPETKRGRSRMEAVEGREKSP